MTAGPGGRPSTRFWLVAGLLFAAATLYLAGVATDDGRAFEAGGRFNGTLDSSALESVADVVLAAVVPVAFAAAALVALLVWRGSPNALAALIVIVGANVVTQATKFLLERVDPTGGEALRHTSGAFPSGHSTLAASAGLAMIIVAARPGALLTGLVLTWIGLVNATLVLREWHYPSDIAAGTVIAVVAAVVARPPPGWRSLWPLAAGTAAVAALTMGLVLARFGVSGRLVALTALAVALTVAPSPLAWVARGADDRLRPCRAVPRRRLTHRRLG